MSDSSLVSFEPLLDLDSDSAVEDVKSIKPSKPEKSSQESTSGNTDATSAINRLNGGTTQPMACRLCGTVDNQGNMIVPCLCHQPSAYVHRDCHDDLRAANFGAAAFDQCKDCEFKYVVDPVLADIAKTADSNHHRNAFIKAFMMIVAFMFALYMLKTFIAGIDSEVGPNMSASSKDTTCWLVATVVALTLTGIVGLLAYTFGSSTELVGQRTSSLFTYADGETSVFSTLVVLLVVLACSPLIGAWFAFHVFGLTFRRQYHRSDTDRQPLKDQSAEPDEWVRLVESNNARTMV